jgi:flagellar protein FliO/FliZ
MADMETYARFLIGLVFVLALILALAWVARQLKLVPGALKMPRNGPRRLSVIEAASVDAKRRLVLVRRDNVEHLVLLGPTSETIVETGITPPASSMPASPSTGEPPRSSDSSTTGTGVSGISS